MKRGENECRDINMKHLAFISDLNGREIIIMNSSSSLLLYFVHILHADTIFVLREFWITCLVF